MYPLILKIQEYKEELILNIVDIANHDLILGIPWLRFHNLSVD